LYWEEEYFDLYSLDDSYDLAQEGIHFNEFKDFYLQVTKQEWEG
ncbi:MAG: protein kinase, partial [Bacillus cereus]|nr:protein kinase [Bacillus cereus]